METARRSDTSQLIKAFASRGPARIRNALYLLIWPAIFKGPSELCIHRGQYHQSRRSGWLRQHYLKRENYREFQITGRQSGGSAQLGWAQLGWRTTGTAD